MLHLICALKCEAQPLIKQYRLNHVQDAGVFPCYINPDCGISLTISGIGKVNAAAATSYTYDYFKCRETDAWLNVGIAGHQSIAVGRAVLAHKILDTGNGNVWYPQIVFTVPCDTQPLKTLDKPCFEYEDIMFDMEASGFYSIASRFATTELIHVIKVISDNSMHPVKKPDKKFFSELVEQQLQIIAQLIDRLISLSSELAVLHKSPEYFDDCIKHWHFTNYERHVLARLLGRWHILRPGENPLAYSTNIKSSKEVISLLETTLESSIVRF